MGEKDSSMSRDIMKHAITTAVGVMVTFYVTSAIKKDQYQKDDVEKEKQRMEALEKTNKLLSDYVSRYDSLHSKYIALLDQPNRNNNNNNESPRDNFREENPVRSNAVSQSLVTGNWITPDGTVVWRFLNNKVNVSGVGSYAGVLEASGNYSATGSEVNGTVNVSKLIYLPYNESMRFSFTLSEDGKILYGNTTDASGNSNVVTLYKNL